MATSGPPLWKGTFFFNMANGGFTESVYAGTGGPTTYGTMMRAMLAILPKRLAMSQTVDMGNSGICINPVVPIAIRVTNLSLKRAVYLNTNPQGNFISFNPTTLTPEQIQAPQKPDNPAGVSVSQDDYQNDSPNVAAKCQFTDGQGHNVNILFHGFPNYAMDNDYTKLPISGYTRHLADVNSKWVTNLGKYSDAILAQNLGFRWQFNSWVPAAGPWPNPPWPVGTNGDSRPLNTVGNVPTYNAATDLWTFTMAQPLPFSKMRVILRGFKNLNFLNGRYVAQAVTGTSQLTIQCLARDPGPWDGNGTICPETFQTFSPLSTIVLGPDGLPGAQFGFITSKKVGRPFVVERGRISRRRK